jgi:predicted polyphosphate/ATP-dependent NAD kinase
MKKAIGLIVNPVAGMGGSVGLKGTDGEMYKKALELGAKPVAANRTRDLLGHIEHRDSITLFVAPGTMGEEYVEGYGIPFTVIGTADSETSAQDTKRISDEMVNSGIRLLIFVGGDGTARDIHDAIDARVPVVAVPSGVKVFSSVFAVSARAAAQIVDAFVEGVDVTEEDVLDIDEEAFRDDRLASKLYGYLLVPSARSFLQSKKEIAMYLVEAMDMETLYLVGPGTTLRAITDEMSLPKTLLGVDAILGRKLFGKDLNEEGILGLLENHETRKIIVTPIGGNGFIFGRGSKQFTPEVIRQVGKENIMVVGTQDKVSQLDCLRVDTGDSELDERLSGHVEVTVGYREGMMMEVKC